MRTPRTYQTPPSGVRPAADRDAERDMSQADPLHPAPGPRIRPLSPAECEAVLRRHQVGRLAYAFGGRVDILPLHFVYDDGWLYARTSPGHKLETWQHSHWVALEVDEVRALFDWTSVVVHGGLYVLRPDGPAGAAATWEHAVDVLRRLVPDTGTAYDPVPWRSTVLRMHADEITGRTATPAPAPS